jgi:hypothetical protein
MNPTDVNERETTNYLHRNPVIASFTKSDAEKIPIKKIKISLNSLIISSLLLSNILLLVYIIVLQSQKEINKNELPTQSFTSFPTIEIPENIYEETVLKNISSIDPQLNSQTTIQNIPTSTSISPIQSITIENLSNSQPPKEKEYFTQTLGMARDMKRQADLQTLTTTLYMYQMENENLPDQFPNSPRCIGTNPSCYDLYRFLIPNYLEKSLVDPSHGTTDNTGYSIGLAHESIYTFVAQATSDTNTLIEVKK